MNYKELIKKLDEDFATGGKWCSLDDEEWIPLKVSEFQLIKDKIELLEADVKSLAAMLKPSTPT